MFKKVIYLLLINFCSLIGSPTVTEQPFRRAAHRPRSYALKVTGHTIFKHKKLLTLTGNISTTRGVIETITPNKIYSATANDYAQALWEGYCHFLALCQAKGCKKLFIQPFDELWQRGGRNLKQELNKTILDAQDNRIYTL